LLQKKLVLISQDGILIDRLKTWVLRCHACFKITTDLSKVFCFSCGNNTLLRTSCSIDSNGNISLFLKKNFQYKNRGSVYSIPETKGGRHSNDLILREDQREYAKVLQLKKRVDKKALNYDIGVDSLVAFSGNASRLSAAGAPVIGFGRRNPNQVSGRRRK
jgi:RNA-binding protein NOB1